MTDRSELQVHRSGVRPTGPPKRIFRPEDEIKAEGLREAATAWLGVEDHPSDPVYRFLMERADHISPVEPS